MNLFAEMPMNLANTPGFYYALAYWLATTLICEKIPGGRTGVSRRLLQLLELVLLESFMILTDGIDVIYYFPCIALDVAIVFFTIRLVTGMEWKKSAYFTVRTIVLGEFAASLEWQLFYYGLGHMGIENNLFWNLVYLILCHTPVFLAMYLLESRYEEGNRRLVIGGKDLAVAVLMGAFIYGVSNISYVYAETPFSTSNSYDFFIIRTLVDLAGVGMLFAYHVQLNELTVRLDYEFLQNMTRLQYEQYKMSQESVDLVNQKYHDLKHQIRLLRSELDEDTKVSMLDRMEEEIKAYEASNKTGNKVLDTILTMKSLQCQKQGISLTCVADGEAISFMEPADISALFGNALDNAMESVLKIEEKEHRLIHVSLAKQKGFLRLRVENCYEGTLTFRDGLPETTKKDSRYHGFGMRSIAQIVRKYKGSVTVNTREGWFELRVLIPVVV